MVEGFIYPNERVLWGLMIVLYPYFTGLHTGPLLTSAVYYTFEVKKVKPLAKLALVMATAFVIISVFPLILHLGRPERAFEIFWTPHVTSAMAVFGFIYLLYLLVLLLAVYFCFRPIIIAYYNTKTGFMRLIYSILTLGYTTIDKESLEFDRKIIKILLLMGLPLAAILHGYVGFIFGGSTANTWWRSPLMPVIFLTSGLISGIALLILVYLIVSKLRKVKYSLDAITSISKVLWVLLVLNTSFELLEIIQKRYEYLEEWPLFEKIITSKLAISYMGIQFILGAEIPIILIAMAFLLHNLPERTRTLMIGISSLLILIGVIAMRWNVVIGGQLYSKTIMGILDYEPEILGKEGLLSAILVTASPFVLMYITAKILPPWEEIDKWAKKILSINISD